MVGGFGDDVYVVDAVSDLVSEAIGGGRDAVLVIYGVSAPTTLALGTTWVNVEAIRLGGTGPFNLVGDGQSNLLVGNDDANFIDGGAGQDRMEGGLGDDVYVVDVAGDVVIDTGGIDWIVTRQVAGTYVLASGLEKLLLTGSAGLHGVGNESANVLLGNTGGNSLGGNSGNDSLSGDAGDDTLDGSMGADVLWGGDGNDTYLVDNPDDAIIETNAGPAGGIDTVRASVDRALGGNLENLVLTGAAVTGAGNGAANIITGNAADNLIDGGLGADTLTGGPGNDIYIVDLVVTGGASVALEDRIFEALRGGTDTVVLRGEVVLAAAATLTLGANLENLDASATGTTLLNLTGNTANDVLIGNAATNLLDGAAGSDTLIGGAGDDTYIVDVAGDAITDSAGTDTVVARLAAGTYTLATGLENLTLGGAAAINGAGNAGNNTLTGNAAANTLDGGIGADTMIGLGGNDSYVVDDLDDLVTEAAGPGTGTDTVRAGVDYTLGDNVENLVLTGTALVGAGNALTNLITGNAGNNTLDGAGGNDSLIGGAGDDTYLVDLRVTGAGATAVASLQDTITEVAVTGGIDTVVLRGTPVLATASTLTLGATLEHLDASNTGSARLNLTGNAANNALTGNAGNNVLDGGAGADTLIGGAGDDIYVVNVAGDQVAESADQGIDLVRVGIATAGGSYDLGANVEHATLTSTVVFSLTGNERDNALSGGAAINALTGGLGNDTLDGGGGADSLDGGENDDTYIVDVAGDAISDSAGTDTVVARLAAGTYTLAAGLENLTLGGAAAINGTGNDGANAITGNGAANILNGLAGADTMSGGGGNDTYVVDDTGDRVAESAGIGSGLDTVRSGIDYALPDNVENLVLTGAALTGTGNVLNNLITGTAGNNTLDGGAGADSLIGGAGDDTYLVDLRVTGAGAAAAASMQDTLTEVAATGGIDAVVLRGTPVLATASTLTLGATLEHLDASDTGTTRLNLTGNAVGNVLTGNAGNNVLDGAAGADSLIGGAGDDIYVVNVAGDQVTESADQGIDLVRVGIATAGGSYELGANIEHATLTSAVAFNLTGNDLGNALTGDAAANTLTGGLGNDTLDGGGGADSLDGGVGEDTYGVDVAGDAIADSAGLDTVVARLAAGTYTLAAGLENLTLGGAAAINGTGNAANNVLTGNAAANTLDGSFGADTMIGLGGNDTYVVDDLDDVVTEAAGLGTGIDTVRAGVDYTLGDNVENLVLTGAALAGTGNVLANAITGTAGANTLDGGLGNDALIGGAGLDSFVFSTAPGTANRDTIQGFVTADDTILLDDAVFQALAPGALDAGAFVTGTRALDVGDRILFNAATGALFYDADGSDAGTAVQFATLTGRVGTLTAADFEVV